MFQPFRLERYFAQHEFSAKHLLCTSDCESMTIDELLEIGEPAEAASEAAYKVASKAASKVAFERESAPEPEPAVPAAPAPAQAALVSAREKSSASLGKTWLGYTESRGAPALRAAIAALYRNLDMEDVLVHSGAEEAILNTFLAMVGKDALVIVNTPCYQSLMEIPAGLGAKVIPWQIRCEGEAWRLDTDALDRLLASARRGPDSPAPLVVLNMPHNPTGALISAEEFDSIIQVCRRHGAILFMDEVYRLLEYDEKDRLPAVCEVYENGISLSVLSKAWGLAGLRIGWLATRRRDILDKVAAIKDYNSICASAPSEQLALLAIGNTEKIVGRNRAICAENRALFSQFFKAHEELFSWIPPRAGSVAFPSLKAAPKKAGGLSDLSAGASADLSAALAGHDAELFSRILLAETGVLLLPGVHYAFDKAFFRIGLGRRSVPVSLAIFDAWLRGRGL